MCSGTVLLVFVLEAPPSDSAPCFGWTGVAAVDTGALVGVVGVGVATGVTGVVGSMFSPGSTSTSTVSIATPLNGVNSAVRWRRGGGGAKSAGFVGGASWSP